MGFYFGLSMLTLAEFLVFMLAKNAAGVQIARAPCRTIIYFGTAPVEARDKMQTRAPLQIAQLQILPPAPI